MFLQKRGIIDKKEFVFSNWNRTTNEKNNGLPFLSLEFILQTAVTLVPFENVLAESSYFFFKHSLINFKNYLPIL